MGAIAAQPHILSGFTKQVDGIDKFTKERSRYGKSSLVEVVALSLVSLSLRDSYKPKEPYP